MKRWIVTSAAGATTALVLCLVVATRRHDSIMVLDHGKEGGPKHTQGGPRSTSSLVPSSSSSSSSSLSSWLRQSSSTQQQQQQRYLQQDDDAPDADGNAWVYSQYATIVPDPEFQPPDQAVTEALEEEWGAWHFWDGTEDMRPAVGDYCAAYPFRDVPAEDFDDDSWQADAVFVNHILDSGTELVQRAQDAIYAEYGFARNLPLQQKFERNKMFKWEKVDTTKHDVNPTPESLNQGGWTTSRSISNLARRLLHAVMTNDEFVVVVVGGPQATGNGNHFRQSYAMQLHRVVAPVLARMGVKLVTRNLSHRHGGSLPAALAKIWQETTNQNGGGIDVLIWDEGPWERTRREKDLFLRQALTDMAGTLPHASQYLHCDANAMGVCRQAPDEYCATCWIPRDDIPDPKALFPKLADQVLDQKRTWNPGWRRHQLTGRLLAYTILDAFQDALQSFTTGTASGPPLDGYDWHMGELYETMRSQLAQLSPTETGCAEWDGSLPARLCTVSLQGATQHTPRVGLGITDIIKPGPGGVPVNPEKMMYAGYDVHNTCFDPQGGDVPNIVAVVSGRRKLAELDSPVVFEDDFLLQDMPPQLAQAQAARLNAKEKHKRELLQRHRRRQQTSSGSLETGAGWQVVGESPGQCDGTYTSICGRAASDTCPLLGQHDSQGQVRGDDSAGWLVLNLENVTQGLIMLGVNLQASTFSERMLGKEDDPVSHLPASFVLDISIDGKLSTWNRQEFVQHYRREVQWEFDALLLLDEESFVPKSSVVEVGVRLRDCSTCTLGITHVFWA
eukprot:scaffold620_cov169-Amphora_coffeaeformis.AAC.11